MICLGTFEQLAELRRELRATEINLRSQLLAMSEGLRGGNTRLEAKLDWLLQQRATTPGPVPPPVVSDQELADVAKDLKSSEDVYRERGNRPGWR